MSQPEEYIELIRTADIAKLPDIDRMDGRVLLVEDAAPNRILIRKLLSAHGLEVLEAETGEVGLQMVRELRPDVVLLDVILPRMSGFEVCVELKADEDLAHIPVLMLTRLTEREYRIKGVKSGANDFIAKPIDQEDLLLRVRNAVHSTRLVQAMAESLHRLRELEALKENLSQMIMHDLRSPLTSVLGNIDLVLLLAKDLKDQEKQYLENAVGQVWKVNEMIASMADVSRLEENSLPLVPEAIDLVVLANEALGLCRGICFETELNLEPPDGGKAMARVDRSLILRVLTNLLSNAIGLLGDGGKVTVRFERIEAEWKVLVVDNGPGIPDLMQTAIFEKFRQLGNHSHPYSSGLGLAFCKLACEAHQGRIGVVSKLKEGASFWFTLPALDE